MTERDLHTRARFELELFISKSATPASELERIEQGDKASLGTLRAELSTYLLTRGRGHAMFKRKVWR